MRQRNRLVTSKSLPVDFAHDTNEPTQHDNHSKTPVSISEKKIFFWCLAFRLVNALLVQTYFNPDEHWQALEVAHKIVFGYGHLTWEWKKGIRSYLHPMIFAFLYKVLAFLHLDTPWFMLNAPRMLQSIYSAIGDLYLYKLSKAVFDDHVARWALFAMLVNCFMLFCITRALSNSLETTFTLLFAMLVNWFMFFCITRTLSNSLETTFTLVSLFYWSCMKASSSKYCSTKRCWGLAVAALACAIRPTSAITWVYVGLIELFLTSDRVKFMLLEVVPIGTLVLGFTFLVDRLMYGSWTFVPLNFLKFNFLSAGGDYYGTHPWHWYFTQGFTVMGFTFLPFAVVGAIMSREWKFSGLIVWVLGIYSILGHKEFRFVLPVLPIALMFSGYALAALAKANLSNGQKKGSRRSGSWIPSRINLAVGFLLLTNLPMALYMSLVHQRGTEDVMYYLSREAVNEKVKSILFLTPCHATPYYSTLHHNIPMRFLDCTPSEEKGILDESDRFMMDPVGFTAELMRSGSLPSHIVLFDSQEKLLHEFLVSQHFFEIKRFFHAHFKVDRDLQTSVVVYAFQGE